MTILLVDDDAGIRQLLTVFLTHKGYDAVGVANGLEALNYLQRSDPLPQLILLDLMMPVMDGAAFREVQRQDPQLAQIPVVVMSAAADMQEQAPLLLAAAYVPKPIDFDMLLALVEQYCRESRQRGT
jgi:CheY-like chemotaxis protein